MGGRKQPNRISALYLPVWFMYNDSQYFKISTRSNRKTKWGQGTHWQVVTLWPSYQFCAITASFNKSEGGRGSRALKCCSEFLYKIEWLLEISEWTSPTMLVFRPKSISFITKVLLHYLKSWFKNSKECCNLTYAPMRHRGFQHPHHKVPQDAHGILWAMTPSSQWMVSNWCRTQRREQSVAIRKYLVPVWQSPLPSRLQNETSHLNLEHTQNEQKVLF